ncbi:MAG: glycosyltransferase [Clostridia bacterium]|nr:glycosyltransferase [Clostridia bacterium]
MRKILFFIPTLGGGGAEKVLINLVNNLDFKKYDVTVQTLFDYGINKQYLSEKIKYRYFLKKVFRANIYILKLFSPKFLFKKVIKEEYDIIVSYLEGPTTRIVSGCNNKNTRLFNWVHTELKDIREFKKTYRSLKEMKKCYSKFEKTIFVSNEAEEAFKKIVNVNSQVIRNIIDVNDICNKANESVNETIMQDKKIKIITLGRLIKVKGYDRLLRIHKKLIEEGINHSLYILGEGNERIKLEQYIKKNNLENSVILLGFQSNPYKYLKEADIYVCSSYKEGYNTAVIEAIILGKPVVTTDCSGMKSILEDGKYGIITNNDEHELYKFLKKMILDVEYREKFKKLSEERKKHFNINNQIMELYNLFE